MNIPRHPVRTIAGAIALCFAPALAIAGATRGDDDWHYRANVYAFLPEISGGLRVPTPAGDQIDVDADDLIDNLKFAVMGGFEAQKGRWGVYTDLVYMDVGDSVAGSPALAHGSMPLPPGVTGDASLDIKAIAFTAAANYRVVSTATDTFDVFGGARLLHAKAELEWRLDSPAGPVPPPQGAGRGSVERDGWDGVVGIKGRHRFGDGRWFVPYYADVGTGESDLTWQVSTGLGYSADWGDVFLVWRHLAYDFARGRQIDDLQFSGPALGVAFNW